MTQRLANSLLLAFLIAVTAVSMLPFVWVTLNAFKGNAEIFGKSFGLPREWLWGNFQVAWTQGRFGAYFANSLISSVAATIIGVVVACPAGYAFAKLSASRSNVLFWAYLFGLTLPAQAIIVPLFYQLRSYGLTDNIWGLVVVLVGTGTPFAVFLMRSFYRDLPNSLLEAARIDGASEWTIFWYVMLPLSMPAVLALSVFTFLSAWNEYLLALLLLQSEGTRTIPTGLVAFANGDMPQYGPLFAGIVLAILPSIAVYVILQRSFTEGLVAGSVK